MIVNIIVGYNEEIVDELTCLNCIQSTELSLEKDLKGIKSDFENWEEYNNFLIQLCEVKNYDYVINLLEENRKIVDTVNFMVFTIGELKYLMDKYNPTRIIFANNYEDNFYDMPF